MNKFEVKIYCIGKNNGLFTYEVYAGNPVEAIEKAYSQAHKKGSEIYHEITYSINCEIIELGGI